MRVAIDPGHGGSDPGAVGPAGSREADINLAVSLKLKSLLEVNDREVIATRQTDTDCSAPGAEASQELQARCDVANMAGVDLFISIHCNAAASPDAHGTETWYYGAGNSLADSVQRRLVACGLANRGVKQGNLYVLKYTDMPAILVEAAFISNPEEERLLNDADFQHSVAMAIARGIEDFRKRGDTFE